MFRTLCALVSTTLLACSPSKPAPVAPVPAQEPAVSGQPWTATRDATHPLVGRIWSSAARAFVGVDGLYAALAAAPYVLLGEKHDAPDHHRLQAASIHALVAHGVRPAVAFEMIDTEQQSVVDGALATPDDPDAIGEALAWDKSGWPPFALYRPIFVEVRSHTLSLCGAGMSRSRVQGLAGKGAPPLAPELRARYHLDEALPGQGSLEAELLASHCGALPKEAVARMVVAQRLRDGVMATTLAEHERAVLVAGSGHARRDRGVPWLLQKLQPARAIVSVAFVEVQTAWKDPQAYGAMFQAEALPFDFVWFTPRLDDDDPCGGGK